MTIRRFVAALSAVLCTVTALPVFAQELLFWNRAMGAREEKALRTVIQQFEAANPGVTVKLEIRSVDEHKSALRIATASKAGPDIYYMWAGLGLGGEFVKSGLSAPLDDFYKKYNWDARLRPVAAQYTSLYPPGRHGVPYTVNGEVLYYNKALFKKAGIDTPPQTYADLLGAAEKLKKAGIPAFTFGGSVNWHVMRLMDAVLEAKCGAQTHDALKAMTVKWSDSPCANDAFKDFQKWISDYTLKPFMSYDQVQSRKLFFADRAAMMLEGDWMVAQLRAEAKDPTAFAIFPFPTGTNRLYGFGTNLIINPNGKKDLAARFIDFYTSDKVQQENLGNFGALGINRNVAYKDADELDKAWLDIFAKYNATFVNGDQGFPLDVTTEYFRVINAVASDTLEPTKAAATLQTFIDKRK